MPVPFEGPPEEITGLMMFHDLAESWLASVEAARSARPVLP